MPKNKTSAPAQAPAILESVEDRIHLIRGQRVMLDRDLAILYGVPTFRLNEQVKRNRKRFPEDFMFQLTGAEVTALTSQFAMSNTGRGGRRTLPYAFTEQGVAMLSSVLNSERAIEVNIAIMRAFIRLRSVLAAHKVLARKIAELEQKTDTRFEVITKLIKWYFPDPKKPRPIGFRTNGQ